MNATPEDESAAAERSLRSTWSIGPLRPWLKLLAERQMPAGLRGRVDPSDLVQQALIDAWRGHDQFRGRTHAERLAWLRVILTRAILRQDRDQLRTAKRGRGIEVQLQAAVDRDSVRMEQLAVDDASAAETQVDRAERLLALAAALDELPEDYRQVLTLRHIEGLSHEAIADRIGRSPAAARMLWVRALEKLRSVYQQP
ncbi:sigma-70 family RNA polymerase sigma factor [Roseiconus nitratireducens]|uniref:Sigma-70 family RNA polymerase sigma factor n=1 Tax=Roseiconus nitratireducens TaxID=2605748 RepID=A0A5M6D0R9_9BACT|nr:sigma-70 family RNA polymerase sigma factor [Roseiconus nitratireducens]KAA5538755.1 sigma-70 family RNA polymerase sigma factor [Roseiconus nitratireducens]